MKENKMLDILRERAMLRDHYVQGITVRVSYKGHIPVSNVTGRVNNTRVDVDCGPGWEYSHCGYLTPDLFSEAEKEIFRNLLVDEYEKIYR